MVKMVVFTVALTIARQDPAEPPIEVPDSEVVGEVLSIMPPDEVAALIAAEFQTAGGR